MPLKGAHDNAPMQRESHSQRHRKLREVMKTFQECYDKISVQWDLSGSPAEFLPLVLILQPREGLLPQVDTQGPGVLSPRQTPRLRLKTPWLSTCQAFSTKTSRAYRIFLLFWHFAAASSLEAASAAWAARRWCGAAFPTCVALGTPLAEGGR